MMSMLTVDSDTVTWWSWSIMIFAVSRIRLRGHKDNVLLHWRWRNRQWFGNREHQAIPHWRHKTGLHWCERDHHYGQLSLWGVMCYSCVGPISPSPLSLSGHQRPDWDRESGATQPGHRAAVSNTLTILGLYQVRNLSRQRRMSKKTNFALFKKDFLGQSVSCSRRHEGYLVEIKLCPSSQKIFIGIKPLKLKHYN